MIWHCLPVEGGVFSLQNYLDGLRIGAVRVANGMANRVDRLRALGNGQIPEAAATAFRILSEGLI